MTRAHRAFQVLLTLLAVGCSASADTQVAPNVWVTGDFLLDGGGGLELPFNHSVGATECPQRIDTLELLNSRSAPVTITITGGGAAIEADPSSITVAPGETEHVEIRFTCSMPSDVNETLTIEVRDAEGNPIGSPTTIDVRGSVS